MSGKILKKLLLQTICALTVVKVAYCVYLLLNSRFLYDAFLTVVKVVYCVYFLLNPSFLCCYNLWGNYIYIYWFEYNLLTVCSIVIPPFLQDDPVFS